MLKECAATRGAPQGGDMRSLRRTNFGGNVRFVPAAIYRPRSPAEVLDCMRRHPGERLRCIGSGHSWSRIIATDGVLFDLRHLKHVQIDRPAGVVRVGGGCTLRRLLRCLRRHGLTLPTLGATALQTIAGAISTGTHGSGEPSLSHFVEEATVATFDAGSAVPCLATLRGGPELQAARCALGSLGVIVEVALRAVPAYRIEERVENTASLEEVLGGESEWPLQQFALLPWSWTYLVYRRRRTQAPGGRLRAFACRAWNLIVNDFVLHLVLKGLLLFANLQGDHAIRSFFVRLPRFIVTGPSRTDASEAVLTMHHELFRHVEMELFVPESRLREAIAGIQELVRIAGEGTARIEALELLSPRTKEEVWKLRGSYTLHYPLFVRRVLPDDTLVSMASATGEPARAWYSISLFSYRKVDEDFARFAGTVARCMIELAGARLHWGKYFPIPIEAAAASYPRFAEFEQICLRFDPGRRFWY